MIVGAGNAYVAEAKRQLFGEVGIDLLAGPTEIAVIADEQRRPGAGRRRPARPGRARPDLAGDPDHRPRGRLGEAVLAAIDAPARDVADARGRRRRRGRPTAPSRSSPTTTPRSRCRTSYAPEHLEVQVAAEKLDDYLDAAAQLRLAVPRRPGDGRLRRQGGRHQPRAADACGAARYTGGLWVGKFLKTCTYQRLTEEGTRASPPRSPRSRTPRASPATRCTATMRLERLRRPREAAVTATAPRIDARPPEGRVVVVAGASRGIGAALRRRVRGGGRGAASRCSGRTRGRPRAASPRGSRAAGARGATRVVCDVTRRRRSRAPRSPRSTRLDVLVNAAGTNRPGAVRRASTPATFDRLVGAQRARGLLRRAGGRAPRCRTRAAAARSSSSPRRWATSARRARSVYCATKHAVEGLTKALAVELAPRGIRVVCASRRRSSRTEHDRRPFSPTRTSGEQLRAQIPLGRFGDAGGGRGGGRLRRLAGGVADDRLQPAHRRRVDRADEPDAGRRSA